VLRRNNAEGYIGVCERKRKIVRNLHMTRQKKAREIAPILTKPGDFRRTLRIASP
jgi:hypothetical protein